MNFFSEMIEKPLRLLGLMAGVYCPTCESKVEVTATYCLTCGHDLNRQGPITSTGHDLNQLKEAIRMRDDLSMAEKFDMIGQIENGANPIELGIAAAADDDGGAGLDEAFAVAEQMEVPTSLSSISWGSSDTPREIILSAFENDSFSNTVTSGKFDSHQDLINESMDIGLKTLHKLLEVSQLKALDQMKDIMVDIPIMKPPKKSFCPKCGSDIIENTMFQWKKWQGLNNDLLAIQLESSMSAALMHAASSYIDEIRTLKDTIEQLESNASEPTTSQKPASETKPKQEEKKTDDEEPKRLEKVEEKKEPKPEKKPEPKKKSGGMFGAKKPKRTYEGEPGGKAEWFLKEALDTVYDPHGTGKNLKPNTILARSSDGNVRVKDVILAYAEKGEGEIPELAHTSPVTKYLIEAFDKC
jgi:hypothetical protein